MSALIGKKAKFFFSQHEPLVGTIKHVPQATGDSFVIRTIESEFTDSAVDIYIQQYDYMVLYPEPEEQNE